jgi:hypothetical protein
VPVGVVHLPEVVHVDQQDPERLAAGDLPVQRQLEVPAVVELSEVVDVGEPLHLVEAAQVGQGEGQVAAQVRPGDLSLRELLHRQLPLEESDREAQQLVVLHGGERRPAEEPGRHPLDVEDQLRRRLELRQQDALHHRLDLPGDPLGAEHQQPTALLRGVEAYGAGAGQLEEGVAGGLGQVEAVLGGGDPLPRLHQGGELPQRLVVPQHLPLGQRAIHRVAQHLGQHRLDQVLLRAVLDGQHRWLRHVQRGGDDDLGEGLPGADMLEQPEPVAVRKRQLGDHRVVSLMREGLHRRRPRALPFHFVAGGEEVLAVQVAGRPVGIHQEDSCHGGWRA